MPARADLEAMSVHALRQAYEEGCSKAGAKPLASVLAALEDAEHSDARLTVLRLDGVSRLTEANVELLEPLIGLNPYLQDVSVGDAGIDGRAMCALVDMILYFPHCNVMHVKVMSGSGGVSLSDPGKWTDATWKAACDLVRKQPSLTSFDLSGTSMSREAAVLLGFGIRTAPPTFVLTTLRLEDCGLSGRSLGAVVAAVRRNRSLRNLYLGKNKIKADGVRLIASMLAAGTPLTLVDLRDNPLGDSGAQQLAVALRDPDVMVEELVLWGCKVGRVGVGALADALKVNRRVQTLNLGNNNIRDAGAVALKDMLLHNTTLSKLGLVSSGVLSEGAIALSEALSVTESLIRLDLRVNKLSVAGVMALGLSVKHNWRILRVDVDDGDGNDAAATALKSDLDSYCQRNLYKEMAVRRMRALGESASEASPGAASAAADAETPSAADSEGSTGGGAESGASESRANGGVDVLASVALAAASPAEDVAAAALAAAEDAAREAGTAAVAQAAAAAAAAAATAASSPPAVIKAAGGVGSLDVAATETATAPSGVKEGGESKEQGGEGEGGGKPEVEATSSRAEANSSGDGQVTRHDGAVESPLSSRPSPVAVQDGDRVGPMPGASVLTTTSSPTTAASGVRDWEKELEDEFGELFAASPPSSPTKGSHEWASKPPGGRPRSGSGSSVEEEFAGGVWESELEELLDM